MNATEQRIVFAGGGSGGTIAPGIAVAERLREQAPNVECVFLCSQRAVDSSMLTAASMPFHPLPARSPARSPLGLLRFAHAWRATRRRARPLLETGGHVVALGGFVAPPVVQEAGARGLTVTLLNLDSVAGRANRWIARRAKDDSHKRRLRYPWGGRSHWRAAAQSSARGMLSKANRVAGSDLTRIAKRFWSRALLKERGL